MKTNIYIKTNVVLIIFLISGILFSNVKKMHKKVENYSSDIEIKKLDYVLFLELDDKDLKKAFYDEDIINKNQYLKLCKYLKKNLGSDEEYPFIMITKYLTFKSFKKYSFYNVDIVYSGTIEDRFFKFAVRRDGKKMHRFGRKEGEFLKEKFGIRTIDIKFFNKMVKEEKVVIKDPCFALDICILFLKITYSLSDKLIEDPKEIELLFKEKELELKNFKKTLSAPLYKKDKNKYYLKFFTYGKSETTISIENWNFIVTMKGEIEITGQESIYVGTLFFP